MTTQPPQSTPPPAAPAAPPAPPAVSAQPDGIETFVEGGIGKLYAGGILTPITRITVRKSKDAQGKVVEKTPLDSLSGTVWAGIIITVVSVVIIRILAML